jgi:hypothetical protein
MTGMAIYGKRQINDDNRREVLIREWLKGFALCKAFW